MIKDRQEYRISLEWLERFERAMKALSEDEVKKTNDRTGWQLQYDGVQAMWKNVKAEIAEYETLLEHDRTQPIFFKFPEIDKISKVLIQARIAFKLSQYELAYLCGLTEASIKSYEENDYQNASFLDIIAVSDALGIKPKTDGLMAELEEFYQNRIAEIRSSECLAS